jgi:hypothetical protein
VRPNGLPGCPHTLHPPRRLHHPADDQPLQPEGGDGGRGSSRGQTGGLLGYHPTHHAASTTPCAATGPSARRRPPPPNVAAVSPDSASLCRPPAGSGLLALPGAASPPCIISPSMGTSPNQIYRPATRLALSDLYPAAQHEKNSPPDTGASATPREKRRASPPPSLLAPRVVPRG